MSNTTTTIPERDAYTTEEARVRLGGIAQQTIYELLNSGELASFTIGKRRLVPAAAITDYIARRMAAAKPPTESYSPVRRTRLADAG